jgi:iron complex outermembrane receptor protein
MSVRRVGVFVIMLAILSAAPVCAQIATIRVEVVSGGAPVTGASVVVNGIVYQAGESGVLLLNPPPGAIDVVVMKEGLAPSSVTLVLHEGEIRTVVIDLQPQAALEERVTVVATRTDRRIEDQPMRVEVLDREEIEEKLMMTPGDIVMMLNEMGGLRVQATSPSLGAASVRIQGMQGRYTRFFSDGLPLFGEVGGLGLLQIPPMDLGQVEVIKGVASSLYGAGAMGGVVNLISRHPGADAERELLVNQSTRGATDVVGWFATPARPGGWSATLLGGGHWQKATDVNGDAWADLPGYSRALLRPRAFWDNSKGSSFFATIGLTAENRHGGTVDDEILPAAGGPYREALDTRSIDGGAVGQVLFKQRVLLSARGAIAQQRHDHQFGEIQERDRHDTAFGETAIRGTAGRRTWVAGFAIERDAYAARDVPRFDYDFLVPGAFAQYDVAVSPQLSLSGSARLDHHSEYGTFFSPRLSALARAGRWTSRFSVGTGFFGPTPITEETEAAGLTRLELRRPLDAERGLSTSFDISRTNGALSYTATLFASRISDPLHVERSPSYVLSTLPDPTTNVGLELLGTWRRAPFSITASYTYVRARETVDAVQQDVPLTPRHSAGLVGMWEAEGVGRIGIEWYYTGTQSLEENPYRLASEPYMILGLLAERQFGRIRVFVNGENLADVRQTRWDPLLLPSRAVDGRWTVDSWAPLEGRNINGGVRVRF